VLASGAARQAAASMNFRSDFARLNEVSDSGMNDISEPPSNRK